MPTSVRLVIGSLTVAGREYVFARVELKRAQPSSREQHAHAGSTAFSDKVDAGSPKKIRPDKKLERYGKRTPRQTDSVPVQPRRISYE